MAKVFPLFLVALVLVVSVSLFFAIPIQEQPANALIYYPDSVYSYQAGDLLYFRNIPRTHSNGASNGFRIVFDVNTSYVPFHHIDVYSSGISSVGGEVFTLWLKIENGYLKFYTGGLYPYQDYLVSTSYTYPYKLEIYFSSYWGNLRYIIKFNDKRLGVFNSDTLNLYGNSYNVLFADENSFAISADEWSNFSSGNFTVGIELMPLFTSVYRRDWSDFVQSSYDAGYIDGMNDANDAKVNLFPSIIGSIFAFFASIASYEVLGISLLNIMIIVGSVLLLLAVLRVFLK